MIRFSMEDDLPQLHTLWQEAFLESAEDTASYFTMRHQHENMLVDVSGDEVTAMLSLLPVTLKSAGWAKKARYIFAVATKKNHRGLGISTRLMEEAHKLIKEEGGVAGLLVPAEESLFSFYQKRGYETAFFMDENRILPQQIQKPDAQDSLVDCAASEYFILREALCENNSLFVSWDVEALTYIKESFERSGGRMLKLKVDGRPSLAISAPYEGEVHLKELLCAPMDVTRCLALLHEEMKGKAYIVRTPAGRQGTGLARPFGMIHWLDEPMKLTGEPPYLSLAKD